MTDIIVTSPFQPFTLPNQFKAVFNGYIYCGTVDAVDPSVSHAQVYLVNESGDKVPVAQPLRTNAGGFLVYNGQPAKFVTSSNHSLLVRDSLGNQLWYAPNMAEIDPAAASFLAIEALRRSYAEAGYSLIGTFNGTGLVVTTAADVVLWEPTGIAYSYSGTLPHIIAANETPIGNPSWVAKSAESLKANLATASGTTMLGYLQPGLGGVSRTLQSKVQESLSVLDFGAKLDADTDDTVAIQKAVDAAIAQDKGLYFPKGTTGIGLAKVTADIIISAPIRIYGDVSAYAGLFCFGCNGFSINAGVTFVTIETLSILQAIRYSDTPNSFAAIKLNGTNSQRCANNTFQNLFIDGFGYGVDAPYTWSSVFFNIKSLFGGNGIRSFGLSVNNFVTNCQFNGSNVVNTIGIELGDGVTPTEGWVIRDNLLFGFGVGCQSVGCAHVIFSGNIVDFCQQRGMLIIDSANSASINWIITDNYIALESANASTGIYLRNNFNAGIGQNLGHSISNNIILRYEGTSLPYGILIEGTADQHTNLTDNRVKADLTACRIRAGVTDIKVKGNTWLIGGIESDVMVDYSGNTGAIASSDAVMKQSMGKTTFYHGTAAPTSGTYVTGDITWAINPLAGGSIGWVCTTGGSPGTWKTFGAISV